MTQLPPNFPEGERAVLGALILDNDSFGRVQGVLAPEDFYDSINREIFEAMVRLREEGEPVDLVTLTAAVKKVKTIKIDYLISLVDQVPSAANVLHYARHIKDRALKRQVISASKKVTKHANRADCDASELLSEFEELLGEIRISYVAITEDSLWRIRKDTESLLDLEEKILAKEVVEERLPSGFLDIDYYTGGFFPGNLVVLAARSGMGKTAMALDMSWHMAKLGHPCLYCSFEMTRKEVARRLVAKECHVDILDLKRHTLNEEQLQDIRLKMGGLAHVPYLVDERNLIPTEIGGQIIRLNNQHPDKPIEVLCIDHVQLMGVRDTTQYQRRDLQLAAYTNQLKDLAKRLGLVVILLSQLNRQVVARDRHSHLPKRSDIRDSGAIEENADIIIGVHRDYEDSKDDEDKYKADVVLVKNRDGMTGKIKLCWKPEWATFTNLERIERPEPTESYPIHNLEPLPEDKELDPPVRVLETQDGTYSIF